jgi:hypothetical protein
MAYNVGFLIFDLGGLYATALPTLNGVLDVPALGPASTATSVLTPFSMSFAPPPSPPGPPGTLLVTDPSGPGDFFRSGPVPTWPAEPVSVTAGTGVVPLTYGRLTASIPTPISIPIPGGVTFAIGLATGFLFTPFNINLTSVILGPSPTPGRVRASFRGTMSFVTLFIPRRTDVTGSVDLTLTPSGNASVPATIVNVGASNLALSTGFTTPLSTPALALLAPLFSSALSGPLTTRVNAAFAPFVATARAMGPLTSAGTPLFSASATVSARRITVAPSGVLIHAILSELIAMPAAAPGPGPVTTGPGAEPRLVVTIDPPPDFDVTQIYTVHVRREADLAPVEDATVTITTYLPITGAGVGTTAQTNAQGVAALETTLRARYRPSTDPTHTGQFQVTWPSLTVTKTGFQTYRQELSGMP